MKTKYNILTALLGFAVLVTSCRKDFAEEPSGEFFVSDTETLTFKQEGETKTLLITAASAEWEIVKDSYESWITAVKDGNKIQVIAKEYNGAQERSSKLTIAMPQGKKTFTFTQFGTDPVLRIEGDLTEFVFKKDATKHVLNIITNSDDWRVESLGQAVPWLKWEKNTNPHTLTLDVSAFLRNEENATTNRHTSIFVSNGSKHIKLDVLQRGWAQFGEPKFPRNLTDLPILTREEIIAHEQSLGHERKIDFENLLYPEDKPGTPKQYLAFSTDGEQTPFMLYHFPYVSASEPYKTFSNRVVFLAKRGETPAVGTTFVEEDLKAWMDFNKYRKARPLVFQPWQGPNDRYERYYMEDDKVFHLYKVYNDAKAYAWGVPYCTAKMEYQQASNYISVGKPYAGATDQLLSFPTRDLTQLHKARLEDVIAYEETQGMIPDYSHALSVPGNYPGVKYSSLIFKQKVLDSSKKGNLIHVLYRFNSPNALDGEPGGYQYPSQILSRDPDLAGTVGSRRDIYMGKDLAYNERTIAGNSSFTLNRNFRERAIDKCFDFVRSDESGFASFVRGEDLLVDISPVGDWLTMEFYRSKTLVDLIKQKSN